MTTRFNRLPGVDRDQEDGEQTRLPYLLVAPTVIWYIVFLLIPMAIITYYSFLTYAGLSVESTLTLDAWRYDVFNRRTADVFVRSIGIGLAVSLLTLVFGYPLAYYLRFHASQYGGLILLLFLIIPFWTSGLVRTTGWFPLLGRTGVINGFLLTIGIIEEPLSWLLYSRFAQIVGYLQSYILFMAAPIYISMFSLDDNLLDASETLRGGRVVTFHRVIWPLSLPGVAIGSIFVFVLAVGDFFVPQFLSGGQSTVTTSVFFYIETGLNYPTAAALSIAQLLIILGLVSLVIRTVDITEMVQ